MFAKRPVMPGSRKHVRDDDAVLLSDALQYLAGYIRFEAFRPLSP